MREMDGKFMIANEVEPEVLEWGELRWLSHPPSTKASQLTVIDVKIAPGEGHDFHKHPDQEEVLYVVSGSVEQWVDQEKRMLSAGDSAFVPANMVHASFNAGTTDAQIVAILGPCVGDAGYELVDVAQEAPWKSLRS